MSGWTNKGKLRVAEKFFRDGVTMYAALVTDAVDLSDPLVAADINTFSQLTEIPAGNGYTAGGVLLTRDATDFPTLSEDDTGNIGKIAVKDLIWTADGGPLPLSGTGARYLVFCDNNATPASREVLFIHDLAMNRIVSDGQPLQIGNTSGGNPMEIRIAQS
jgi:hypothetical protein